MAKKLSTLVIDAVVNTTGIDRAVSNINNKLKGVGGKGVGTGGDGRFSSGLNSYGMASGGGFASAAFGAALGSSAGGKASDNSKTVRQLGTPFSYNKGELASFRQSNMLSRFLERQGRAAFDARNAINWRDSVGFGSGQLNWNSAEEWSSNRARRQRLANVGKAFYGASSGIGMAYTRGMFSQRIANAFGSGGLLGGIAGVGALMKGYQYISNFAQQQYGQFNDLNQFTNTPFFETARSLKMKGLTTKPISMSQGMMLGGRYASGGNESNLEKTGLTLQRMLGNSGFGIGAAFQYLTSGDAGGAMGGLGEVLYPGSPLRQMLGEDPQNLSSFAQGQRAVADTALKVGGWLGLVNTKRLGL